MTVLATKNPDSLGETCEQPDIEATDTSPQKWAQPVDRQTVEPFNRLHAAKVKRSELILFTTQLAVMLDSGVALSDALDAIAEQAEHGSFKMIIMEVAETIKSGENFSYVSIHNGANGCGGNGDVDVLCFAQIYENLRSQRDFAAENHSGAGRLQSAIGQFPGDDSCRDSTDIGVRSFILLGSGIVRPAGDRFY
jgi:hypothetical protein